MSLQQLPVWRIEMLHLTLALSVMALLLPMRLLDPWAFIIGGLFMGINFLLLGLGLQWTLASFSQRGRVRAGIFLLVLKMTLFLGLTSALFMRVRLDGLSFAAGVSCLLVAILLERFWSVRITGA